MDYVRKICGKSVFLSPPLVEDYKTYTKWLNDIEVARGIHQYQKTISYENEKDFLEKFVRGQYNYAIVKNDNTLIGTCALSEVDLIDGVATLGIFIGEKDNRNKGYGSEAINLLVDYGFKHLNLRNIMLKVYEFNKGAIKCYEKCGFETIGIRTKSHYFDGKYYDEIFMQKIRWFYEKNWIMKDLETERGE